MAMVTIGREPNGDCGWRDSGYGEDRDWASNATIYLAKKSEVSVALGGMGTEGDRSVAFSGESAEEESDGTCVGFKYPIVVDMGIFGVVSRM